MILSRRTREPHTPARPAERGAAAALAPAAAPGGRPREQGWCDDLLLVLVQVVPLLAALATGFAMGASWASGGHP